MTWKTKMNILGQAQGKKLSSDFSEQVKVVGSFKYNFLYDYYLCSFWLVGNNDTQGFCKMGGRRVSGLAVATSHFLENGI